MSLMAVNFIYEFCSKAVNKPKGIIIASRRNKPSQSCGEARRAKAILWFSDDGSCDIYKVSQAV